MLKRDLSRAYRQLRVDPSDYRLLGFKWDNNLYFDIAPPFGLRTAAQACQRTTNALSFILDEIGVKVINYVDDIACVAPSEEEASSAGEVIDSTIEKCGLVLAHNKSVNATQSMTFLGILFDSRELTMSVTPERMTEILEELKQWKAENRRYAMKKEIQSLVGKLQFIAKCCKPGRCFMSRILAALKKLKKSSHKIYLNKEFRCDVDQLMWIGGFISFHIFTQPPSLNREYGHSQTL